MRKGYPKNYIRMFGFVLMMILALGIASPLAAKAAAPELKLNVKSKALVTEKTYSLKVYNLAANQTVTFKSDHPEFASVDENGLVSANSVGTAIITATVKSPAKTVAQLECEITVGPPAISVKLTQPTIILMDGGKALLKTILQPLNTAENVKFSSLDNLIASVSSAGRITARSMGTTYIVAAIDNGKYDTCKVIIVTEETYQALLDNPDIDPLTLIPLEANEPELADGLDPAVDSPADDEFQTEPAPAAEAPVTEAAQGTDAPAEHTYTDAGQTEAVTTDKTEANSDAGETVIWQ